MMTRVLKDDETWESVFWLVVSEGKRTRKPMVRIGVVEGLIEART